MHPPRVLVLNSFKLPKMQNSESSLVESMKAEDLDDLEGLSEELKTLFLSLPMEKGREDSSLLQYQGFWHNPWLLQGIVTSQQNFHANQDDLFLISPPKSGTTWLKALAFAIVNRKQYSNFHQQHPLLTNNPHDLVPFLEISLYSNNQIPDLTSFPSPRLLSTHVPYVSLPDSIKQSGCKLVYLCRDPKDTFISLWHFGNQLSGEILGPESISKEFEDYCKGVCIYGPFWDHILGYWKESLENSERVLFLKYEEMKAQPSAHLIKLAKFLGCPFSEEEEKEGVVEEILKLCSFKTLSNLDVNKNGVDGNGVGNNTYFRKGEVGDSANNLTLEMIKQYEDVMEHKFQGSGLTF